LRLNPNGRVPVIEDPNTGIRVWEPGAIVEDLVETYDKEAKLTYTTSPEKWSLRTGEHFQLSVQDQYFGQKGLFYAGELVPSESEEVLLSFQQGWFFLRQDE
jgi:glutathione S-transferase